MKFISFILSVTFFALLYLPSPVFARDKKLGTDGGYNLCDSTECYRNKIPLHEAVKGANFEEIKNLIASGDDINESNWNKETALSISILSNQSKITDYLLQNGANPNIYKKLITDLISKNDIDNLSKIFKAGVSVNGFEGEDAPLTTSISMNNKPIIDMLLLQGAEVNVNFDIGRSPLKALQRLTWVEHKVC